MYGMTMMCLSDNTAKRVGSSSVVAMSEKTQSLKGVMYGMTRMRVLSDNTAKRAYYSGVFVMSEKTQSLNGMMYGVTIMRLLSNLNSFR